MVHLDYHLSELLERIGKTLGMKLGRKHYHHSLIVPIAVREWVERTAAEHPEVARLLAEHERREQARAFVAADRRRQQQLDRKSGRVFGTAPDDARAVARHG